MALATTYDGKLRIINDILAKMGPDEKKIVLQSLIKEDMKAYFEVIWDEQKRLEAEAGVEGVCEYTSDKSWDDESENKTFDDIKEGKDSGIEVNLAGKVSKEAENAYYFDEKRAKKAGNDRFDGFLGYVNSSGNDENDCIFEKNEVQFDPQTENEMVLDNDETEPETTLEAGEFVDKISEKIEEI